MATKRILAHLTVYEPSGMPPADHAKIEHLMREALSQLADHGSAWPLRHMHAFVVDTGEDFKLEYAEENMKEDALEDADG